MISIDGDSNAYREAIYGWGVALEQVQDGEKIRVTFGKDKPKTGYAYLKNRNFPGVRYTKTSMRWWELLQYHKPLIRLEVQREGNWETIWERKTNVSVSGNAQ